MPLVRQLSPRFAPWVRLMPAWLACAAALHAGRFEDEIRPLLREHCNECHSTERHKGDLDLERFSTEAEIRRHPAVWQGVVEQVALGEMPPKEKSKLEPAQRERLLGWVNGLLDEVALERAGDPGPVVLRRLSNAEYTHTLRDLTGVRSLDPAREFPTDSASGEGFMNVGNSLVMSPSMVTKYLDAAKAVAAHAVLVPDGLRFSPSTSQRDWTEEILADIRSLYGRWTRTGGGTAVDLQGIRFDTRDGGVLPLEAYLDATLLLRREAGAAGVLPRNRIAALAGERDLNPKYLGLLWDALRSDSPSPVLGPVRARWRAALPGEGPAVAATITPWQRALWRFTTVGHIGKRDGPKAWQVPASPLAEARELRLPLPAPGPDGWITFHLVTDDAGDGPQDDLALWENPRLSAPGRPDIALANLRDIARAFPARRLALLRGTRAALAAAEEALAGAGAAKAPSTDELARRHGIDREVLDAWFSTLGMGDAEAPLTSHMSSRMERAGDHDFIQGWTGADALSVIANSSDNAVRVPGNMKPHGVAVHPSPSRRVVVSWRSPAEVRIQASGLLRHAHPECGNGVAWTLDLRRGPTRIRLASGTAQGDSESRFGPIPDIAVRVGDALSLSVGPRDGNHSCDLTAVDLTLTDGTHRWDLASDVSPDILAGNPHADRLGHAGVWHFHSEPDTPAASVPAIPPGSLLSRWQLSTNSADRPRIAEELGLLLTDERPAAPVDPADARLREHLLSLNGPLLRGLLQPGKSRVAEPKGSASANVGLDPALFGPRAGAVGTKSTDLAVSAPSVLEVRVPAELAAGAEFVATGRLHPVAGPQGSIQMQPRAERPAKLGLSAGAARETGGKGTWSDGERPVVSDSPILVRTGSAAGKRLEAAFDEFRNLFPAALCYTKIVPVDEVVTLTLYHREDDHFRRLLLDEDGARELDRLWARLHFVSQDALKLVDGFEQLWQFATQDADPSAFEPLREPIRRRAESFRAEVAAAEPRHLEALVDFAALAYRRPISDAEQDGLRGLYRKLRAEDLPHEQAIRLTLARVLVAPAFLYHAEKAVPGDKPGPVDAWELASRLSYFLWSSAPDDALRSAARDGSLVRPEVLRAQVRRMLKDPRISRLSSEFAATWLHLYAFDELSEKSERHFPTFEGLRADMYGETLRFFTDLFQNDGSVLGILDADHTFVTAALAKHYGIEGIEGEGWHRVEGMRRLGRGGVLGQATVLAKQSGASRTSPILRGNWLAEVLLGDKLPKPPKDVPRLPEDEAAESLTVRQLTEKHSNDPRCYGCHRRIDPFGFSLEAFDAIGRSRGKDLGGRPIDTRVRVLDGSEFDGLPGLRAYLVDRRRDAFLRQFCRKLLGYSLGRGVLLSDGPLLTRMRDDLKAGDHRFSGAVESVVLSRQFREIRGKEMASGD
jgi:hypothetical protein